MQLAKARSERLMFAPSLSFCPALFVSEALSLHQDKNVSGINDLLSEC
jgi:hypothetical protein